jgi:uncharacterized membrane protein
VWFGLVIFIEVSVRDRCWWAAALALLLLQVTVRLKYSP